MNVCFLLSDFIRGGIGRVTSIIANELNKKSNINCFGLCHANDNKDDVFETSFPVYYVFKNNISMRKALLERHYIKKVRKYVVENDINILVACDELYYPVAVIVARMCHIKVICWLHTSPNVTTDYKFQKEAREFGARFSDCNLLLSKQAQRVFNQRYPRKKNIQIYNPIDPKLHKNITYHKNSKKIISIGRLSYSKDFERLVSMASEFLKNYPEWSWDIYGDGSHEDALVELIKEKEIGNQLHLCGQVEDIYERYNQYAFIVMTSRFEGFPMTLLEAAANGLPMIAFDVLTGPREIISNGSNGFLCNHKSDKDMIDKIKILMSDEELREKMSIISLKSINRFEINAICEQWIEMLENLK